MKPRTLILTIGLLVSSIGLFGIGEFNRIPFLSISGGSLAGGTLSYLISRLIIIVPGRSVYRLESSLTKKFTRLLHPGMRLLRPGEFVSGTIDLRFFGFPNELSGALSADNIPHHITYEIAAECHPEQISPAIRADISEFLSNKDSRDGFISSRANECLRIIMGDLHAQRITNGYRISDLNIRFKQALTVKLGIFGIELHRATLGDIRPPADYQDSLLQSERRRIETDIMLSAISRLAAVVSTMSESDKALIGDIEKYRLLSDSDAASFIIQNGEARDSSAPIVVRDSKQTKKPSG